MRELSIKLQVFCLCYTINYLYKNKISHLKYVIFIFFNLKLNFFSKCLNFTLDYKFNSIIEVSQ